MSLAEIRKNIAGYNMRISPLSPEWIRDENEQEINICPIKHKIFIFLYSSVVPGGTVYLSGFLLPGNEFPGYFRIIFDLRTNIYFIADLKKALSRGWLKKAFFTSQTSRMLGENEQEINICPIKHKIFIFLYSSVVTGGTVYLSGFLLPGNKFPGYFQKIFYYG
jgi:hypothetical protein